MSKLNNFFASAADFARFCPHLPRVRTLGSNLLNTWIILVLVVPNIVYGVQAAIPEKRASVLGESNDQSFKLESELREPDKNEYQAPVFTHPEPRSADLGNPKDKDHSNNEIQSFSPLLFIENQGQFDSEILFLTNQPNGIVSYSADSIWVTKWIDNSPLSMLVDESAQGGTGIPLQKDLVSEQFPGNSLNIQLRFLNGNPDVKVEGIQKLVSRVSYFIGKDQEDWFVNIPSWGGVRYENLYPGIDLEIKSRKGKWSWELFADQDADLSQVSLMVEGADYLEVKNDQIILNSGSENFLLPLIRIHQTKSTLDKLEPSVDGNIIRFPVSTEPSSITEQQQEMGGTLLFSTLIGGLGDDYGQDLVRDEDGSVYLTGYSASTVFSGYLSTTGYSLTNAGGFDAYIVKINPQLSGYEFMTFLGGGDNDYGYGLEVVNEKVYISGPP